MELAKIWVSKVPSLMSCPKLSKTCSGGGSKNELKMPKCATKAQTIKITAGTISKLKAFLLTWNPQKFLLF